MFNPDLIYYGLSVIMLLVFIYTMLIGFSLRKRIIDYLPRKRALGIILFALGATITLLSGIILLLADRDRIITDLQYQMLQYSIFYVAMGLILFGTDSITIAARNPGSTDALIWKRLRIGIGILFIVSIIIACSFLFNPGTYTITQVGSRTIAAQQQVFFLPLIFALAVSAIVPAILSRNAKSVKTKDHLIWFALASMFVLIGLIREGKFIPSSGNQIIDNLIVFVPFTISACCLFISARIIRTDGIGIRTKSNIKDIKDEPQ